MASSIELITGNRNECANYAFHVGHSFFLSLSLFDMLNLSPIKLHKSVHVAQCNALTNSKIMSLIPRKHTDKMHTLNASM